MSENMRTVMLSIKPEYLQRILNGTKKFEFRRTIPRENVSKIVFYCTAPTKKVVAWAEVSKIISGSPAKMWKRTRTAAGISAENFDEYFENCECAYAYQLGKVHRYRMPKSLEDFGLTAPPQSFAYVKFGRSRSGS